MDGAPHHLASSAKRSWWSIEHNLAKVGVVGSNPIARSIFPNIIRVLADHARFDPAVRRIGEAWGKLPAGILTDKESSPKASSNVMERTCALPVCHKGTRPGRLGAGALCPEIAAEHYSGHKGL
jgi:hypothetical protein